ncbi:hypothetical protein AAFF_G00229380 [Aldrovandia affinis]|uniref:Uncharacterized protein n=1 Tax=Aldrovandia affinis TaxID=143900 RepID=A0AAD7SWP5_9TELE|nr:hypothetical protein AAFF_G00229380 [Aldrovandia affinis]
MTVSPGASRHKLVSAPDPPQLPGAAMSSCSPSASRPHAQPPRVISIFSFTSQAVKMLGGAVSAAWQMVKIFRETRINSWRLITNRYTHNLTARFCCHGNHISSRLRGDGAALQLLSAFFVARENLCCRGI